MVVWRHHGVEPPAEDLGAHARAARGRRRRRTSSSSTTSTTTCATSPTTTTRTPVRRAASSATASARSTPERSGGAATRSGTADAGGAETGARRRGAAGPAVEEGEVREVVAEHLLGVGAEPRVEHRRVDLAEVGVVLEVAVVVEARRERRRAVEPAVHVVADHEERRRGAVVGAARVVVLGPAPELRERHQRDPVAPRAAQRGEERVDRASSSAEVRRGRRPGPSGCRSRRSTC